MDESSHLLGISILPYISSSEPQELSLPPDESSVWIIARPIDLPDYISFISRGRLPFCHWGILVSHLNHSELQAEWFETEKMELEYRRDVMGNWGNLYELHRDPETDKTLPNVMTDFGPSSLVDEWAYAVAEYVGTTRDRGPVISQFG